MEAWLKVIAIIVSFCGGAHTEGVNPNDCRHERLRCIRNGQSGDIDVVNLLDDCMRDPKTYPTPLPAPKASAAPTKAAAK